VFGSKGFLHMVDFKLQFLWCSCNWKNWCCGLVLPRRFRTSCC